MRGDAAALLDAIARDLRDHLPCDSEPCATCTQLVPGEGDPRADVVLVGEAPGAKEDLSGRPFVGASGALLDELLAAAGLDRGAVFITNVVKARPPHNRDPRPDEVRHHRPWLDAQLEVIEPKLLVPLGRHALGRFVTGVKISDVHGRVVAADDGRRLFPLYHPAAALRGRRLRETLFEDARALGAAIDRL